MKIQKEAKDGDLRWKLKVEIQGEKLKIIDFFLPRIDH